MRELPTVPCRTCGEPTIFTGTRQCDDCHEVEGRLAGYLRRGGDAALAFVLDAVRADRASARRPGGLV